METWTAGRPAPGPGAEGGTGTQGPAPGDAAGPHDGGSLGREAGRDGAVDGGSLGREAGDGGGAVDGGSLGREAGGDGAETADGGNEAGVPAVAGFGQDPASPRQVAGAGRLEPVGSEPGDDPDASLRVELQAVQADLADVELALDRLAEGAYGTCEACGGPIDDDELARRPTATRCPDHLPLPAT